MLTKTKKLSPMLPVIGLGNEIKLGLILTAVLAASIKNRVINPDTKRSSNEHFETLAVPA